MASTKGEMEDLKYGRERGDKCWLFRNVPQMKNLVLQDRRGKLQKNVADKEGD
jgi:hypothetical protein